jgi:hypothetical protein
LLLPRDIRNNITSFLTHEDYKPVIDGHKYIRKYVQKYDAKKQDTDDYFKRKSNLVVLNCKTNKNLSNVCLSRLVNLRVLHCGNCIKFDDDGLKLVPFLEELKMGKNTKFTDVGLSYLSRLKRLYLEMNTNITDKSIGKLVQLKFLDYGRNINLTDASLRNLVFLQCLKGCFPSKFTIDCIHRLPNLCSYPKYPYIKDLQIEKKEKEKVERL